MESNCETNVQSSDLLQPIKKLPFKGVYYIPINLGTTVYIRTVRPHFSPESWLAWTEIKCKVRVALPKRPKNQFKPVQHTRQQAQKEVSVLIYTVLGTH